MKNVFVVGAMVIAVAATQAAAQQSQPQNRNQPANEQNRPQDQQNRSAQQKPAANQKVDQQFAMDAAHINMAEVQMGNLAKEKGSSEQVKDFAERLVTDHSKALDELKSIAQSKNITLPTSVDAKHKATHDKLSKLSGQAFDRSFAQEMVTGHKEALQKAQTAAKSAQDPQIKEFASKMVTSVQAHLKIAQSLAGGAVGTSGSQDRNPSGQSGTPDRGRSPGSQNPPSGGQPGSQPGGTPDRDPR